MSSTSARNWSATRLNTASKTELAQKFKTTVANPAARSSNWHARYNEMMGSEGYISSAERQQSS
eukprot:563054-Amphidinium_carterae.1